MTDRAVSERRASARVSIAFLVATGSAIGLATVYALGGQTQLEGALLALAFLSIGVGLVTWAKHLLPQGPYAEKRSPLPTSDAERRAFTRDLERAGVVTRRTALVRLLVLAGAAVGGALVIPLRSLGPRPSRSSLRTQWADGRRAVNGQGALVRATDIPVDGLVTVYPEGDLQSADGQAVLMRVDPRRLVAEPGREDWAPEGLVAYSKVCTHAGCPVGLFEPTTNTLLCPCHQSAFDVLRGARPVTGPAAWPLPQLPLTIDADGNIASTGDFSAPVGPGWWAE
jgi:ubiquinol-cytochrome c reductase iron-sulfur subunit